MFLIVNTYNPECMACDTDEYYTLQEAQHELKKLLAFTADAPEDYTIISV